MVTVGNVGILRTKRGLFDSTQWVAFSDVVALIYAWADDPDLSADEAALVRAVAIALTTGTRSRGA